MESPCERSCPSCSAPAQSSQHWCLECGAELPQPKRSGLRPAIGIATTLTVLVGAASAGGYTLLQDGKKPPPPAATIAQQPPPVTAPTTPPADTTAPPADATDPAGGLDGTGLADTGGNAGRGGLGGGSNLDTGGGSSAPPPLDTSVPDYSDDIDTSTPNPPPPDDGGDDVDDGNGSLVDDPGDDVADANRRAASRARSQVLRIQDVARDAPAIPYPFDATDLQDGSPIVDGDPSTAWSTPTYPDPATQPQVGVFVELASAEHLTRLVLRTPTPGMSVEIYAAKSGPPASITAAGWSHLATKPNMPGKTAIDLPDDTTFKYVLVWVTGLPPGGDHAEISELKVLSQQPV